MSEVTIMDSVPGPAPSAPAGHAHRELRRQQPGQLRVWAGQLHDQDCGRDSGQELATTFRKTQYSEKKAPSSTFYFLKDRTCAFTLSLTPLYPGQQE